jgi:hypothetical protein
VPAKARLVTLTTRVVHILDRLRRALNEVALKRKISLWTSARLEALSHMDQYFDGLHFKGVLLEKVSNLNQKYLFWL